MHSTSSPVGRRDGRLARTALALGLSLLVQACGGGGGGGGPPPPPVDHARLDACVLVGANVSDGCTTTSPNEPVLQLGDMAMGETKSRVLALYNGGDGDVSTTVSSVALAPTADAHYTVTLFQTQGGAEAPASLPFELKPNHATELRVRVQFEAYVAVGGVTGMRVDVAATHPATTKPVPIQANVTGCPPGLGDCDGDPSNACETDLQTSLDHCGGCGTTCSSAHGSPSCNAGVCGITCDVGFGNCDGGVANGCETDLSTTPASCGTCGNACDGTNGTPTCTAGACGITCTAGFADCDGNAANGCEVNLQTDATHCGACATTCGSTNGTASCSGGTCGIACSAGFADCDGDAANGCEVDLESDLQHCGGCNTACSTNHGTASCTAGVCGITCAPGFADCDGNPANGCEVDLEADPNHCGACTTACDGTNGTATCGAGVCGITCDAGFGNCDGNASNGCEVNLHTDPVHCGTCSSACNSTNGTATCSAGTCGITCNAGFGNCDGNAANGCEVDLDTSTAHCGACATVCNATNGTASCSAGVCGISCSSGYGDCDGSAANGCEVNLTSDPVHCGACVVACSTTNGSASCTAGVCGISCSAGFGDCDANAANGCEVNLSADPTHCGSCLDVCSANNGTPSCAGGACGITCAPGFADCDGLVGNGCEVNLGTDPANCSACGAACSATNGTPGCTGGTCAVASCDPGYADCDGSAADGCEVNLTADPANCGVCGGACDLPNATPACAGGSCAVAACSWGWSDCDADPANGCEVNVAWDASNCATCGNVCPLTQNVSAPACSAGACVAGACDAGWSDFDGNYADGCECKLPVVSQTCAAPLSLGTIHTGQSIQGPLDGLPGGAAYYAVSFPLEGAAGGGTPRITFARNDGNLAVMDILTDCAGGTYACASEGGSASIGVTDYTYTDDQSPGNYFRNAAWPVDVIVRVRAANGGTCPTYQLVVTR